MERGFAAELWVSANQQLSGKIAFHAATKRFVEAYKKRVYR
jgi:hypothetical protein